MATSDPEQIRDEPSAQPAPNPQPPAPAAADPEPPHREPAGASGEPNTEPSAADQLREQFAEIAALTAQATRLGITVDAADAMRKGITPNALRRSVLDQLAARADATSVIAAAPSAPAAGDSPIVRRAKERAATARA